MESSFLSFLQKAGLVICIGVISCLSTTAQCTNNLAIRRYDTLLSGTGSNTFRLSMPQWSPDSGLLVSVKVSALVSVQYGFTMRNNDHVDGIYSLTVGREDYISGAALPASYDNIVEQKIGVFDLSPGDSVARSPFPFLSNYENKDSLTANLTPFMGNGRLQFTYAPITYTTLHANASYYYHAAATDAIQFSVSYLYCKSGGALATGLTQFTAALEGDRAVRLNWSASNEGLQQRYLLQRSRDGITFDQIGIVESGAIANLVSPDRNDSSTGAGGGTGIGVGMTAASYRYIDRLPPGNVAGKWYYRLQVVSASGTYYSAIKQVATEDAFINYLSAGRLTLYPNPTTDHISLVLPVSPMMAGAGGGNWQVDILSSDGGLIQRDVFHGVSTAQVNFVHALAAGTYFVRATNQQSMQRMTGSFVVRH